MNMPQAQQWIACWPPDAAALAETGGADIWAWQALAITPRVTWLECPRLLGPNALAAALPSATRAPVALALELSAVLHIWGGADACLHCLPTWLGVAADRITPGFSPTALQALARLCCPQLPAAAPIDQYPLASLLAAAPHAPLLARMGVRTWGQLRELPRYGLARRFGQGLIDAIDMACGTQTQAHTWITAPERFSEDAELVHWATQADALLWVARRLLQRLALWLRARRLGALSVQMHWRHEDRRVDGQDIAPSAFIEVRSAQATQNMGHLERLLHEQLQRTPLLSPVNHVRLVCEYTAAHEPQVLALLPEDRIHGMRQHEMIERLSARLGAQHVLSPQMQADHRQQHMQSWLPAIAPSKPRQARLPADELWPNWWLRPPLALQVQQGRPHHQGPLELLSRPQRTEGGWWASLAGEPPQTTLLDCFVARSPKAGLLWVGRERSDAHSTPNQARWLLLGWYA